MNRSTLLTISTLLALGAWVGITGKRETIINSQETLASAPHSEASDPTQRHTPDAEPQPQETYAAEEHSPKQIRARSAQPPQWADPDYPSETWEQTQGAELLRYTSFRREIDGAPILVEERAKRSQPDVLLGSRAFHGRRILLDAIAANEVQPSNRFSIQFSKSGTFATLSLEDLAQSPFDIVQVSEQLRAEGLQVEYDVLAFTSNTPNDPRLGDQWHLSENSNTAHIDAERAWSTRTSASNVVVAILDTGVRLTHEDLDDNLWVNSGEVAGDNVDNDNNGYVDDVHGVNTHDNTGDPDDDNGHGTHVAGIVGAEGNNGRGVSGVAWNVQLMALRFMGSDGSGYISDAIEGIDYASTHGADIINCSFGTPSYSSLFSQAIDRARQSNTIIVAAAGNESNNISSTASYPAAYTQSNVVSVASIDSDGGLSSFSNYSSNLVDLGAPGNRILAPYHSSNSSYQSLSGTSMAAPVVAGILALTRAEYPSSSINDLIQRLESGVIAQSELNGKTKTGGYVSLLATLSGVDPSLLPDIGFEQEGPLYLHAGYSAEVEGNVLSGSGLSYSWTKDNRSISGNTRNFSWASPSSSDSGTYTLTASNSHGQDSASIDVEFKNSNSNLASASGLSDLPWITYGNAQFSVSGNELRSGNIGNNQSVTLQTRAPAEGTFIVDIDVSSESNYDFLHIHADGERVTASPAK